MKLSISNFAKIDKADITIDGITVIAGENNTGKSTIGKILFSVFNSLQNINEKLYKQRLQNAMVLNIDIVKDHLRDKETAYRVIKAYASYLGENIKKISDKQVNNSNNEIITQLNEQMEKDKLDTENLFKDYNLMIYELADNINKGNKLSNDILTKEIITRYFNSVFNGQVNSLSVKDNEDAEVILQIKDKCNRLLFRNNSCQEFLGEINIQHKALYIDNPFVIDELSSRENVDIITDTLRKLLLSQNSDPMDGVIEAVIAKEKLNDIFALLGDIVEGDISSNKMTGELYLKSKAFDKPIAVSNLSTGMKSFVVLKMLLEKGSINDKDVIVLDEPEIHLHPQWQIAYAELLVLLQKKFDLSVVVTTHSPYFVDAINLFSCKYNTDNNVNYYISSVNDNKVEMRNVTGNIEEIYKKMASPIEALDTLRYELNNDEG